MIEPKTILHLSRLYSPHIGGVETHLSQVNAELLKRGYQVGVITTQDQSIEPLHETLKDVQVWRMPQKTTSKIATWKWMWQHRTLFQKADIVQVHDVFWWLWPVYIFCFGKTYITFHGWEGQYPVRWQAKLQRLIASKLSRKRIHIGAWIQKFYWDKPDAILYGGVKIPSTPTLSSVLRKSVFLGRLVPENEVPKYLELFVALKKHFPKLEITWVGGGTLAEECHRYGKVTGMNVNPHKELLSSDVVFANSYLSLLEAQALGKVVISLYSQPLKQSYLKTYPGNEFLIMGNDVEKIAKQLKKIWQNSKARRQLQTQAYEFASDQTWAKIADVYENIWQ